MDDLLTDLAGLTGAFAARAGALDEAGAFPEENLADLRRVGALVAALPRALGGRGFGTEPEGAAGAAEMLRLVGRGHLATGRLFEGHVNAVKLVVKYGGPAVVARVADVARAGGLVGLWVTDGGEALRVCGGVLEGGKVFCSGAGHVGHALVTAEGEDGTVMALVEVAEGRAQAGAMRLSGMRAAVTGRVALSGVVAELVGGAGDYLRQPEFSAGAWRTSAVTLGGVEALVAVAVGELVGRGRAGNAHQAARIGAMLLAQESAGLWVRKAARVAEGGVADAGDIAGYVNLARLAVERAGLEVIGLVQRGLGLGALVAGHPAERLMRDLAVYLRQPAPDETLTEAAAWFAQRELPA